MNDRKHEFVAGSIVAMAGARPPHNVLTANMTGTFVVLTRRRACVTMTSDQRIHVPGTGLYAYPDVPVACGDRKYEGNDAL